MPPSNPAFLSAAAFILSGVFWGSSFLWIKIALEEISALEMVALRVSFGLIGILAIIFWKKIPFPRNRRDYGILFFYSIINVYIPFLLIGWSETLIDSGVASVINGTVPIWTMVFAHFALHDEPMNLRQAAGTLLGFIGVLFLASRDLTSLFTGGSGGGGLWGYVAALSGAISYASAGVFNRRYLRHVHPLMQSFGVIFFAAISLWVSVIFFEPAFALPERGSTWIAVAWMGLLGTAAAFAMFMYVMKSWGASRSSTVNYLLPAVGLGLGIGVLGEKPEATLFAGGFLILLGVAIVQGISVKTFRKKPPTGVPIQ